MKHRSPLCPESYTLQKQSKPGQPFPFHFRLVLRPELACQQYLCSTELPKGRFLRGFPDWFATTRTHAIFEHEPHTHFTPLSPTFMSTPTYDCETWPTTTCASTCWQPSVLPHDSNLSHLSDTRDGRSRRIIVRMELMNVLKLNDITSHIAAPNNCGGQCLCRRRHPGFR